MQILPSMQSYIQDLKSLSKVSGFKNFDKKDKAFELIYEKAQDAKVDLNSAKEFLFSLSDAELNTIQKYKGLANPINIKNLSNEGAYNLLMHGYESIDYNGNGYVEIGAAKNINLIPQEAPHEFREKFINSLKEMQKNGATSKDITMSVIMTLGKYSLMKTLKNSYDEDPAMQNMMREHGIDRFILKTPTFDDDYIWQLKYELEHPKAGELVSSEAMHSMQLFFKAYDKVSKEHDDKEQLYVKEMKQKADTTKVAIEKTPIKNRAHYEVLQDLLADQT